jgi:cell volume regulation protein A
VTEFLWYFVFWLLILASVFSAKITNRFGIPVLFAFLAVGVIVGSDVLNLFYFSDAKLTKTIADLILIFVLFDGGFRTTRKQLLLVAKPAITLATLGVILTAVVLGAFIHLVMHYDLVTSMMIASIISSTDAAAVFLITKQNPIQGRLAATLNVESAANDPMAILLTLAFVNFLWGNRQHPLNLWESAVAIQRRWLVGFLLSHVAPVSF